LDAVGEAGLWDLLSRYEDKRATAVCSMAVADLRPAAAAAAAATGAAAAAAAVAPPPPLLLFRGELRGACVAPRGEVRHGARSWNALFVPDAAAGGDGRTFGEMSYGEQSGMSHRHAALAAFVAHCGGGGAQA
jgi:inosine triphosphate pyrophosphatase